MVSGLEAIYVGAADIAGGKVGTLRNPDNRKRYEKAYREDLKRYGGELTLEKANRKLHSLRKLGGELSRRWRVGGTHRPISKDRALRIKPLLLPPAELELDATIDNPIELGQIAEVLHGEKLPTLRLWIHYKHYVIGVVPDGVADSYVYEFKATTQSGRDADEVRDQAIRQAQLYAYAFKRPNIKVQVAQFQLLKDAFPVKVRDLPKPEIVTISKPASDDEALEVLKDFDRDFCGLQEEN